MAGLQDDTLRIVLVGKTGSGKSATANTILGRKEFDSRISAHAVTKSCQRGMVAWKGRKLLVVDTPGLFDTKETLMTTCKEISRCVLFSCPGPHAIILVVRLDRFTKEEQSTVELIKSIFQKPAMKHMVILFTRKDELEGRSLSEFLADAQVDLQRLMEECGNRCLAFSNSSRASEAEKEAQVQELVELIEEMLRGNRGSHFSNDIYRDVEDKLKLQIEALEKNSSDELKQAIKKVEEQYECKEISEKQKEEKTESLMIKYKEKSREEAENNVFTYILNKIYNILSNIWDNFWKMMQN